MLTHSSTFECALFSNRSAFAATEQACLFSQKLENFWAAGQIWQAKFCITSTDRDRLDKMTAAAGKVNVKRKRIANKGEM